MFIQLNNKPTPLSNAIDDALLTLLKQDPSTESYAASVDQIQKLHKMQEASRPAPVSQDTLVLAATNIAGIVMIIKHEHFNVITSKAISFVIKPR